MKAMIVTYVVKKNRHSEFLKVVRKHWKVLRSENLTTSRLPYLLHDPDSPSVYKEIFEWKSRSSFEKAHKSMKVQKIWSKMMELTEEGGIEAAHFQRL
jgi:hypothetical protein